MKAVRVTALCAIMFFVGIINAHAYSVMYAIDDSWQTAGIDLVAFDFTVSGDVDVETAVDPVQSEFNVPADWFTTAPLGGIDQNSTTLNWFANSIGTTPLNSGQGLVWEVNTGPLTLLSWSFSDPSGTSYNQGNAYAIFDAATNTCTFSLNAPQVPIPPSVLLMVSGMLGLAGLRRKMRA